MVDTLGSETSRKDAFLRGALSALLIHFHSHVIFDEENPMESHIHLGESLVPVGPDKKLTAKDIFSVWFQPGTHITAMSCKSARSHVTNVDDHVRLVTAFHCAGAAS